jgi:hypothetical protein
MIVIGSSFADDRFFVANDIPAVESMCFETGNDKALQGPAVYSSKVEVSLVRVHYASKTIFYGYFDEDVRPATFEKMSFDGSNRSPIFTAPSGQSIYGIVVDQTNDLVYFGSDNNLHVYNITDDTVILLGTVGIYGYMRFMALDSTGTKLWTAPNVGEITECTLAPFSCTTKYDSINNLDTILGMAYSNGYLYVINSGFDFTVRSVDTTTTTTSDFVDYFTISNDITGNTIELVIGGGYMWWICDVGCDTNIQRIPYSVTPPAANKLEGMLVHGKPSSLNFAETVASSECANTVAPNSGSTLDAIYSLMVPLLLLGLLL